jgi:hypothetical protein
MQTHVRITAILFLVAGATLTVAAIFSSALFGGLAYVIGASHDADAPLGAALLGFTGIALTIVLLTFSIPSVLCGWGLLRFRRWARLLGIVLAAIALLRVPFGTLFGAYALWVLLTKKSEPLFDDGGTARLGAE